MNLKTAPPPLVEEATETEVAEDFDRISCRRCGRWIPAPEGAAMLFALKGSCPHCGGEFELIPAGVSSRATA
jgi:ribosomal protein S27AE